MSAAGSEQIGSLVGIADASTLGMIWLSLTRLERKVLRERCEISAEVREAIADDAAPALTIRLTTSQVGGLREAVADQLQRAGFDEKWDVNPEGRLLEGVIDKLQPPQ